MNKIFRFYWVGKHIFFPLFRFLKFWYFFNAWLQFSKLKFLIFPPPPFWVSKGWRFIVWTGRCFLIQNIFSNSYVHWCLACIHICMRIFDLVDWNYKQLWAGMSVLGIELESSGKEVYALNCWAISLQFLIKNLIIKYETKMSTTENSL